MSWLYEKTFSCGCSLTYTAEEQARDCVPSYCPVHIVQHGTRETCKACNRGVANLWDIRLKPLPDNLCWATYMPRDEEADKDCREHAMRVIGLDEYQQAAYDNATWDSKTDLNMLVLGLNGEAGEVADELKKQIRDGRPRTEQMKEELGDCLWYLSQAAKQLGCKLSEIAQMNLDKIKRRKDEQKRLQDQVSDRRVEQTS